MDYARLPDVGIELSLRSIKYGDAGQTSYGLREHSVSSLPLWGWLKTRLATRPAQGSSVQKFA